MSRVTDHDRIVEITTHVQYIRDKIDVHTIHLEKINSRISVLESWKDKVNGALIIMSVLFGAVWGKILKLF